MSLLRILGSKPSQVPTTISAAEVDAAETAKNHSGLAVATNVSGEYTQRSEEILTSEDSSLRPGTLKFEEGTQFLIPRSCLIEDI